MSLSLSCAKANGIVQCYIRRNKSGTNRLFPGILFIASFAIAYNRFPIHCYDPPSVFFQPYYHVSKRIPCPRRLLTLLLSLLLFPSSLSSSPFSYFRRPFSASKLVYSLYLKDGDRFLMCSKKRPNNKTSNYLVSMGEGDLSRDGANYLGELASRWIFLRCAFG